MTDEDSQPTATSAARENRRRSRRRLYGLQHGDPWALFHSLEPPVDLVLAELPPDYHGVTDGKTIWIHSHLTERELRCALMHEVIHVERGDRAKQPPEVEADIEREVARRMLPDAAELAASVEQLGIDETAWRYFVTPRTVRTRLDL